MPTTRAKTRDLIPSSTVLPRCSGVLCHVTSLPSKHGVGDIGKASMWFLDWLHSAGQTIWQFLPLNPHGYAGSPYGTSSAMAADPILISLEPLVQAGLLKSKELQALEDLPTLEVDYKRVTTLKRQALRLARNRFRNGEGVKEVLENWTSAIDEFVLSEGPDWLDDYALFQALREKEAKPWVEWPSDLRDRKPGALLKARQELADDIDEHVFCQFLFDQQWAKVRSRAKELGIKLVGDIPIFVAHDSADVWANRKQFKLDKNGKQLVQAGVPPDYFSATGQLWGNPVYDWKALAQSKYHWWVLRFRRTLALTDIIRIDHFRGFQAAWEVPAGEPTAMNGVWVDGPGVSVFKAVEQALGYNPPVIAEDLGLITEEVHRLRDALGYPGMKVLQFAWGGDTGFDPKNDHLPHNLPHRRCVYYTGTHDNNTTRGWATEAASVQRRGVRKYIGRLPPPQDDDGVAIGKRKRTDDHASAEVRPKGILENVQDHDQALDVIETVSWDFIRLALASVADVAILQLQDALDLGGECRMNLPATAEGNWKWRAEASSVNQDIAVRLRDLTELYGRLPL